MKGRIKHPLRAANQTSQPGKLLDPVVIGRNTMESLASTHPDQPSSGPLINDNYCVTQVCTR